MPAGKVKLVVVGEGLGRLEAKLNKPFVGPSGQLLFDELAKSGIKREDCFITNSALCRGEGDKEVEKAAECCRPRLLRELTELPTDVPILTLGKAAVHSVMHSKRLMYLRGFVCTTPTLEDKPVAVAIRKALRTGDDTAAELLMLRYKLAGRTVIPTVHPAFVLRADPWLPVFAVDVKRAARAAKGELRLQNDWPHYVTDDVTQIADAIAGMRDVVAADIETDGIDVFKCNVVCMGISDGNTAIVVYPWRDELVGVVQKALESKREVVFHNSNFDAAVLTSHGMSFENIALEDSMVAWHTFASHLFKRLDFVTPMYADFPPWKIKFGRHGTEEKGGSGDISKLSPEDLCKYNAADCYATIAAWEGMRGNLAPEMAVYRNDMDLSNLCLRMGREGVLRDPEQQQLLLSAARGEEAGKLFRMRELTWAEFNPRIPKHLRRALFGQLGAPVLRPTASGLASTDKGILTALASGQGAAAEVSQLALGWRYAAKLRSTFVEGVAVGVDGRVHSTWRATGTVSGRLSCSGPNLMQMPHERNGYDPRSMYIARPGYTFVYFDVKTAEMKFAAYLSGDKRSIEEVETSDCYVAAAKNLFASVPGALEALNTDPKGRGKNLRQLAKMARLAANYLIVAESLLPKLQAAGIKDLNERRVRQILDKIHLDYKGYFAFVERNIERVSRLGYIEDPILGRKRRLGFTPPGPDVANFPIQAGIAAIMNKRLLALDVLLQSRYPLARIVVQVHDSSIVEVPVELAEAVMAEVAAIWAEPVELRNGARFVLGIDLKQGSSMGSF